MPTHSKHPSNPISLSSSLLHACSWMKLSSTSSSTSHVYMPSLSIPTITIGWWPRSSLIRKVWFTLLWQVLASLTFNFRLERTSPWIIGTWSRTLQDISYQMNTTFKWSHVMRTRKRHTSSSTRWTFTCGIGKSSHKYFSNMLFNTYYLVYRFKRAASIWMFFKSWWNISSSHLSGWLPGRMLLGPSYDEFSQRWFVLWQLWSVFDCYMCPMTSSIVIFRLNISLSHMRASTTISWVLSTGLHMNHISKPLMNGSHVVGRKFVKYTAHCYSAVLGPIAMTHSLPSFLIIFGPRNLWEPGLYTIWLRSLRPRESLIFIIIPNGDRILVLNIPDSYDSNNGIYMPIHALYKENRNLPCFCLHVWEETWLLGYTSYYISLESYWRDESSAVKIVRIVSVVVEKRSN